MLGVGIVARATILILGCIESFGPQTSEYSIFLLSQLPITLLLVLENVLLGRQSVVSPRRMVACWSSSHDRTSEDAKIKYLPDEFSGNAACRGSPQAGRPHRQRNREPAISVLVSSNGTARTGVLGRAKEGTSELRWSRLVI